MDNSDKKLIILVYGPMCSGKSALIDLLKQKKSGLFHASMDNIKWFISDYSTEKYASHGTVNSIMYGMCRSAVEQGLSIMVEGSVGLILNTGDYKKLAKEFSYKIIRLNIEARYDILVSRFNYRLRRARDGKYKTSIKSKEAFRKRYLKYLNNKDYGIPTIDTSKITQSNALNKLINIIGF